MQRTSVEDSALPSPAELRPGVWSIPVPLSGPLGFVNIFAVVEEQGVLLVDGGCHGEKAYQAFCEGLAVVGVTLDDVVGIVITHAHNDHYGLANRVREASGCWTAFPAEDLASLERFNATEPGGDVVAEWCRLWGATERATAAIGTAMLKFTELPIIVPDVLIAEGDHVALGDRQFLVIRTPGHTPGHVSLVDDRERIVFVGDTLLTTAPPLIAMAPRTSPDPIADYLATLERLQGYRGFEALSGHELGGFPLAECASELVVFHERQLEIVRATVDAGGPTTVYEVASAIPSPQPFDGLGAVALWVTLGETHARLATLAGRGAIEAREDLPLQWAPRRS